MVGVLKPRPDPFLFTLQCTGLKPEEHLFVGDRDETDIAPAKKIGMKTCYVWGQSQVADISFDTVYQVSKIF